MRLLSERLGLPMILDESFTRAEQFADLETDPDRWLINIRVSKMGGILRSIEVAQLAAKRGIRLIIGAQVGETSLLTRAALTVAHSARPSVFAQEGAFGTHLLESDVTDPPIMFGPGGQIPTTPALQRPLSFFRPEPFLAPSE